MAVDGSSGIVVPTGHWDYSKEYHEKLADGVEKIWPDLANFQKRARQHAVDNLTVQKMVNKYLGALGYE
jgi:hypothetical protein